MNENENNSLEENRENIEKDNEVVEKQNEEIESRNNSSRKGKREVVVQYRKPSFFTSLLLFLMGVCVTTVALGCFYMFKLKDKTEPVPQAPQTKEENVVEEKEPETKVPEVNLDVNGDFVKELDSKVPRHYRVEELYRQEKTIAEDIPVANRMLFVLDKMRNNKEYEEMTVEVGKLSKISSPNATTLDVQKFSINDVEKEYKKVYGNKYDIVRNNIDTNMAYIYNYDSADDCFYGHFYDGGGVSPSLEHQLIRAEKSEDGKEIYTYEYFLLIHVNNVYSYSNVKVSEDYYKLGTYDAYKLEDGNYTFDENVFNYFKDKGMKTFKNTFKLDANGNYYWYSTEPVNE